MPRGGPGRGQGRKRILSQYHEFFAGMIVDEVLQAEYAELQRQALEEHEKQDTTKQTRAAQAHMMAWGSNAEQQEDITSAISEAAKSGRIRRGRKFKHFVSIKVKQPWGIKNAVLDRAIELLKGRFPELNGAAITRYGMRRYHDKFQRAIGRPPKRLISHRK